MNVRTGRLALGSLLVAALLAGCASGARREIEADRIKAHAEPLELNGPKGAPAAHIDTDGRLRFGDQPVVLDADQRAATLAYREAALHVVDLSLDGASRYTRFVIPRFLFGMVVHGGPDRAGRSMEQDARKLLHTPQFCDALDVMRAKQEAMVDEVARLRPYVQLTADDVGDCRAGRPYTHSL